MWTSDRRPYVFSGSMIPLLNQMLSLETCLGSIYSLCVFQSSRIPSNTQDWPRTVVAQTIGIYVFMHAQCRWSLSTKTMLNAVAVSIIALDVYGMLGVWTQAVGFHHRWEFWLYQVWYGLMVCPWYSYSQTMVRLPLSPRPLSTSSTEWRRLFHQAILTHAHSR